MKIKCLICGNFETELIFKNYPGYIQDNFFNIYKCSICDSHFIKIEDDTKKLYSLIYSSHNTAGYDRYYRYAMIVKKLKDPLKFLAYKEPSYFPVYKQVKDKKNLNILEIGCGFGYLSYCLKQRGFNIKGIDIASAAINFARENFGDYFFDMDIKDFKKLSNEKFDLIIATEVIEHLDNPNEFLNECIGLLNGNGKIIITTPDKDYSVKTSVWQTDLPPIHITWLGKTGMKIMAQKHNLNTNFIDFSKYYSTYENRLIKYIRSRKEKIGQPALTAEGNPIIKPWPFFDRMSFYFFDKLSIIRILSNFLFNLFKGSEMTMGVILEKEV